MSSGGLRDLSTIIPEQICYKGVLDQLLFLQDARVLLRWSASRASRASLTGNMDNENDSADHRERTGLSFDVQHTRLSFPPPLLTCR